MIIFLKTFPSFSKNKEVSFNKVLINICKQKLPYKL